MPRVIDISQEVGSGLRLFPVFPRPQFVQLTKRGTHGFETEALFLATHAGTHVDSPFHPDSKGIRAEAVQLERLIGRGVLLDFGSEGDKEEISLSDVKKAVRGTKKPIKEGDIILIRTGWDRFLGDKKDLTSHPGFTKEAAEYLAGLKPSAIGLDGPDPDLRDAHGFPVHDALLPRGILIVGISPTWEPSRARPSSSSDCRSRSETGPVPP